MVGLWGKDKDRVRQLAEMTCQFVLGNNVIGWLAMVIFSSV